MKEKISHEGHRQRLKNRFLNSSLEDFEPHNILELLLFYSIPRQDTNEIAHALLNRFGTLKNVFDADITELMKVSGIKENSATLIKLIPQLAKAYLNDDYNELEVFEHVDKVGAFFANKFIGETNEVVYLMLLDNSYRLLGVSRLHEGSVNSSVLSVRSIVDEVVKVNASLAVIAHNHPNGIAIPSPEDIETTIMLVNSLEAVDIALIEHFVVAGKNYLPIIRDVISDIHPSRAPRLKSY